MVIFVAMKTFGIILAFIMMSLPLSGAQPKREFRGAWLHTVFQDGYLKRTTEQNKAYLRSQLDALHAAGVNAVIFQVRPQADAFYPSKLEPWSRFITVGGKAPSPVWDPLQFMIDEAHARGMELHAWLNPYRVTSSRNQTLPSGHIALRHPERVVKYDGKLFFDPGLPENRDWIAGVVADIVDRYDVDGIHFDDYFYPYPVKGARFDDSRSFARYGKGLARADWRRRNVDMLIERIHGEIAARKPWVVFGVSPFGIWRNRANDPAGSESSGLQNYDDLYADVVKWAREGWIDYQMPQLYWRLDNKTAPSRKLASWWADNACGRHVFFGQDVARTLGEDFSELYEKVSISRRLEPVGGCCWWPGYDVTANRAGIADSLASVYHAAPALVPPYPWISGKRPAPVGSLRVGGDRLIWKAPALKGSPDDAVKFVVYRFAPGVKPDVSDQRGAVGVTWSPEWPLSQPGTYVVTALSRVNQESAPSAPLTVSL